MLGSTISHYRITEKLGKGGMGVGYRGRGRTFTAMALMEGQSFDEIIKRRTVETRLNCSAPRPSNHVSPHKARFLAGEQ